MSLPNAFLLTYSLIYLSYVTSFLHYQSRFNTFQRGRSHPIRSVVEDSNLARGDDRVIRKHPKVPEEIYTDFIPILDDEDHLEEAWDGYMSGFDWQLERARRFMEGPAFAPLRMTLWKPPTSSKKLSPITPQPTIWDHTKILIGNALQIAGLRESVDGAPMVQGVNTFRGDIRQFLARIIDGNLAELAGGPLFLLLEDYYKKYGSIFKLAFGPKSFIVVSDPVIVKHILKEKPMKYDKGILAEILYPIMGKGLIPADPDTWKVRRKAIVPGFHKAWLNAMMSLFVNCNQSLIHKLTTAAETGELLNMETEFCSVALDIIGKAVFNYDFGSVTQESPIVKAVYRCLQEAEHRSVSFIPFWHLPGAKYYFPKLREFEQNIELLNTVLNELITKAFSTQATLEISELEQRDYTKIENPSLLRFLVDMRGENTTSQQLRDDLMTMLIAGHETSAAVLTWTFFELAKNRELYQLVQQEIDEQLQGKAPCYEDTLRLPLLRLCLAETLRMYPEPPLLIRRALEDDLLPPGIHHPKSTFIPKGTDIFISLWNLHRSTDYWEQPEVYNPFRFLQNYTYQSPTTTSSSSHSHSPSRSQSPACEVDSSYPWLGFRPGSYDRQLYPNEVNSDFAFLPFGGGSRKCVGDQFAIMESIATIASILQKFDVELGIPAEAVGMRTGATIHTENGLMMRIKHRERKVPSLEISSRSDSHNHSSKSDNNSQSPHSLIKQGKNLLAAQNSSTSTERNSEGLTGCPF